MHEGQKRDWGRLPVTDGLRAIAIVAVVLFHTFPAQVRGGFIGVDVFFAISGFVIALNYLPGLVARETGFTTFFVRRIRRLLPALLAMVLIVSVVAFVLLRPVHLKAFGVSVAAQAIYAQNVAFWLQGDYFDAPYVKPLLHTWSLAVEEQFYFLFPLLVLAFRRARAWGIALLTLTSAAFLLLGVAITPVTPKTVFYLVPFRIWEFAGGIAVALWYLHGRTGGRMKPSAATATMIGGLVAIIAAIALFGERAPLPGAQSLLAIGGTMAVLAAQRSAAPMLLRVADNAVVRHVGLTSYSWYLWHWPLAVFFCVVARRLPTLPEGVALVVGGYAIGTLSYHLFERGNQTRAWLAGTRRPLLAVAGMMAAVVAIGGATLATNGGLFRFSPTTAPLLAAQMDRTDGRCTFAQRLRSWGEICRIGKAEGAGGLLIVGDSHAATMRHALARLADVRGVPVFLAKRNCRPTNLTTDGYCSRAWWHRLAAEARRRSIRRIVVIAHYNPAVPDSRFAPDFELMAAAGLPIWFLTSPPEGPMLDPEVLIATDGTMPSLFADDYLAQRAQQRAALAQVLRRHANAHVLDPRAQMCPGAVCLREDPATGAPLYSDSNHLTQAGVRRLLPVFAPLFAR